jgi:hypothetical protein
MAMAILKGRATIATVTPASASATKSLAEYSWMVVSSLGFTRPALRGAPNVRKPRADLPGCRFLPNGATGRKRSLR